MSKTYFNHAIIGNSRMLGCLTEKGELVRLFWPHIDHPQHIDRVLSGIYFTQHKNSTLWIGEDCFCYCQSYIEDTNIIKTVCENTDAGLRIEQIDFVLPEEDVLIRRYEIENIGHCEAELGFVAYSSFVTTTPESRCTLFDFGNDALIHYKHDSYVAFSGEGEVFQFQLGNNPYESAKYTELKGYDHIGMMPDGALSWKLGSFQPGEKKQFTLRICAATTLKGVKKLVASEKSRDSLNELHQTKEYWLDFLRKSRQISSGKAEVDSLYKRSLLVFKLMSDESTGGLLAAPEIDEGFTKCGRYAYCWGRDAAFITEALDWCGLTSVVDKFYEWAVEVQDEDGAWQQRYHMDGNLAPSWGLQIDETGTLIWGMLQHYRVVGDRNFLSKIWESVYKGVEFLVGFIDPDTRLPLPSYDLWEERVGEHMYSSAAVYGGIMAGAVIARELGESEELSSKWESEAAKLKEAMVSRLWKEDRKCFLRSIRTKLNPWGSEHSQDTTIIKVNSKGYYRDVTLEDGMVDISLLGATIPFKVFDSNDYRMEGTVEMIERVLTNHGIGGIRRYESDNYIGGNPWILTTLWVALYYIDKKDYAKAREYFYWAVRGRTGLGLLPEQVDRNSGLPAWIIPLTWSHAMFILVLAGLTEAGEIEE